MALSNDEKTILSGAASRVADIASGLSGNKAHVLNQQVQAIRDVIAGDKETDAANAARENAPTDT